MLFYKHKLMLWRHSLVMFTLQMSWQHADGRSNKKAFQVVSCAGLTSVFTGRKNPWVFTRVKENNTQETRLSVTTGAFIQVSADTGVIQV